MQISRSQGVSLFNELGFAAAKNWNSQRMTTKIASIADLLDDEVELPQAEATLLEGILEALEAGKEVTVVPDQPGGKGKAKGKAKAKPAPEPEPEPEDDEGDEEDEEEEEDEDEEEEEDDSVPAVPKAKKKSKTKPKAKKEKLPKEPSTPGVRATRTRPFLAGIIIQGHGREAGITKEMVAELDEAYGKPNEVESIFALRNAWHAIRGFSDGAVADLTN